MFINFWLYPKGTRQMSVGHLIELLNCFIPLFLDKKLRKNQKRNLPGRQAGLLGQRTLY